MAETDRGIGSHHIDVMTAALVPDVNPFAADQGDGGASFLAPKRTSRLAGSPMIASPSNPRGDHVTHQPLICRNGWRKKTRRYIWLIRDQGSHKKAEEGNKD